MKGLVMSIAIALAVGAASGYFAAALASASVAKAADAADPARAPGGAQVRVDPAARRVQADAEKTAVLQPSAEGVYDEAAAMREVHEHFGFVQESFVEDARNSSREREARMLEILDMVEPSVLSDEERAVHEKLKELSAKIAELTTARESAADGARSGDDGLGELRQERKALFKQECSVLFRSAANALAGEGGDAEAARLKLRDMLMATDPGQEAIGVLMYASEGKGADGAGEAQGRRQ